MPGNLWCDRHRKMVIDGKPSADELTILAARLMAEFSQHPTVQKALYHDPFFSELHQQARFVGISHMTKCICCVLGDDAVEGICSETFEPLSQAVKEVVIY